jgi:hypothetical protein
MHSSRDQASPPDSSESAAGRTARSKRLTVVGVVTSIVGLALLVYLVQRTGIEPILEGGREVGWGFVAILALAGVRLAVRAVAWQLCMDIPRQLPFGLALGATLSGDALGNVTPLGILISEPAKVAFVRTRVLLGPAAAALGIENFLYTLTVAAVIALGTLAMLLAFSLPEPLRAVSVIALAAVVAVLASAFWMLGRRLVILSALLDRTASGRATPWVERIRRLEARTYELYERRRGRVAPVVAVQSLFHVAGVTETYLTLWLITGTAPSVLTAFLLESVNRLITVVFKFVPLRIGVDEAGTAVFTSALGLGSTIGVTLALVRKARVIVWALVGLAIMVRRGLTVRGVLENAGG